MKKLLDGFLFGLGFSLAMVVVFGLIAAYGTGFIVTKAFSTVAQALSEGTPMESVEGVSLVSSSLERRGNDIVVSAVVTNSTGSRLDGLIASIELSRHDGPLIDFSLGESLGAVWPLSQTNLTFVFAGVDHTNTVSDLAFKLEAFKVSEKK